MPFDPLHLPLTLGSERVHIKELLVRSSHNKLTPKLSVAINLVIAQGSLMRLQSSIRAAATGRLDRGQKPCFPGWLSLAVPCQAALSTALLPCTAGHRDKPNTVCDRTTLAMGTERGYWGPSWGQDSTPTIITVSIWMIYLTTLSPMPPSVK